MRVLYAAVILLLAAAIAAIALVSPALLTATAHPLTLAASVAALAAVGWIARRDLPSAAHCRRAPAGPA